MKAAHCPFWSSDVPDTLIGTTSFVCPYLLNPAFVHGTASHLLQVHAHSMHQDERVVSTFHLCSTDTLNAWEQFSSEDLQILKASRPALPH